MAEQVALAVNVEPEVLDTVRRLAKAEGVSQGALIERLVIGYDNTPIPENPEEPDEDTLSVYLPRDRDMMAAAFIQIVDASKPFIHENHMLSALGLARTHVVKGLPEYQDAEKMRKRWQDTRDNGSRPLTYVPPLKAQK
jgi:hypothetical protein